MPIEPSLETHREGVSKKLTRPLCAISLSDMCKCLLLGCFPES